MTTKEELAKNLAIELWALNGQDLVRCFVYLNGVKCQAMHHPNAEALDQLMRWERVEKEVINIARRSGIFGRGKS